VQAALCASASRQIVRSGRGLDIADMMAIAAKACDLASKDLRGARARIPHFFANSGN
jgi:hypothetical protein